MQNKIKPITPTEAAVKQTGEVPDLVFEAFNELIAATYSINTRKAVVKQEDAIKLIMAKLCCDRGVVRQNGWAWLNINDAYAKVGWKVIYTGGHHGDSEYEFIG